jgi:hypothetical protein
MAVQVRALDRKARRAVIAAVTLICAGPLYLAARLVVSKIEGAPQVVHSEDDQLVLLKDGSTMLLRHGSTGRIMADWLEDDPKGGKAFEVGNENFTPGTAQLTRDGWEHLAEFSRMLRAYHNVSAVVLYSAHHGIPGTVALEHDRADLIRDEAIRRGVGKDQIAVARQGFDRNHNAAADEGLEVVLTNRA